MLIERYWTAYKTIKHNNYGNNVFVCHMPTCRSVWTSIWPDKAVINFEFDVSCLKSWFLCLCWSAQPGLAKVLSERNFGRPLTVRAVITGDRIVGDHANIQHRQFLLEPVLNMTQLSSPREIAASEDLSWQFYRRTYYALGLSSPHDCGCCYRLCPGKAHQCNVPWAPWTRDSESSALNVFV